jgi:hypothetical protein
MAARTAAVSSRNAVYAGIEQEWVYVLAWGT